MAVWVFIRNNKLFASGALAALLGAIPVCTLWMLDYLGALPQDNLERTPLFYVFLAYLFGLLVLMPAGALHIFAAIVAKAYGMRHESKQ